jgi:hypothetical protein
VQLGPATTRSRFVCSTNVDASVVAQSVLKIPLDSSGGPYNENLFLHYVIGVPKLLYI